MITPPKWLHPGLLAYHRRSATCFYADRLQREKDTGELWLLDCAGNEYRVSECEPASQQHFSAVALIASSNPVTVIRQGYLLIVSDGVRRLGVKITPPDEVRSAAESFAQFFAGEVID